MFAPNVSKTSVSSSNFELLKKITGKKNILNYTRTAVTAVFKKFVTEFEDSVFYMNEIMHFGETTVRRM